MKNIVLELAKIAQSITQTKDSGRIPQTVVESICQVMGVDVCSLYFFDKSQNMVLLANHGLSVPDSGRLVLPKGKGLVGLVAKSRHPINIANAQQHPDYFHLKNTQEARYQSFCGVPVVSAGEVIAILVVQTIEARLLLDEEQAFLVTLAAQLAPRLKAVSLDSKHKQQSNIRIPGIFGANGLAVAKAFLCTNQQELFSTSDQHCDHPEQEIQHWHQILKKVRDDIKREQTSISTALSANVTAIFDAYSLLLSDASLNQSVETAIRTGNWLPGALRQTIEHFSNLFLSMDDVYLKARHEDIRLLGNKLYQAWLGEAATCPNFEEPVILVGKQISISDIAKIPTDRLAGIICSEGSSLSHISILAGALGIPAIMGISNLHDIQNGETIIIDGNRQHVILHPNKHICAEYHTLIKENQALSAQLQTLHDKTALTQDKQLITLYTNTGLLSDITPGLKAGAQGIGLYRSEIPFMMHQGFPTEDEQVEIYRSVFKAYAGKPVFMRTLDIGSDKQLPYFPIANETNPALGYRGIRFCLDHIHIFMTQVRAMLRASIDHKQLHILLPMVSSYDELNGFLQLLDDAMQQLLKESTPVAKPKVGIMIEVPAAISQLHFWADKLDFASIGSNDLSQYLLALDRNNAYVSSRYDHAHPAVLQEINRIVNKAQQLKLPISLCGEMASDPVAVVLLIGMGLRTLSLSAAQIPRIKHLIRSISIKDAESICQTALTLPDAKSIRSTVTEQLRRLSAH